MSGWKFEVGKDVVCRSPRGTWRAVNFDLSVTDALPVHGGIYRVALIDATEDGIIWLGLKEFAGNFTFDSRNFEPVRDTDISALRDLLAPIDTKEVEPA